MEMIIALIMLSSSPQALSCVLSHAIVRYEPNDLLIEVVDLIKAAVYPCTSSTA
jgi:hypothetical protein